MSRRLGLLAFLALFVAGAVPVAAARAARTIVFLSDFGTADDSVAICKGVMWGLAPSARIVDLTHDVPPYQIAIAARLLAGVTPYYPAGTVFVGVVDPGVGSARRAIVAESGRGQVFVVPDNGVLTDVVRRDGLRRARLIENRSWQRASSATFHGRDVFAPTAARIARGDDWRAVGPVVRDIVRIDVPVATIGPDGLGGQVIGTDGPYGNLVTNVSAEEFAQLGWARHDQIPVVFGAATVRVPLETTFADVATGAPLAYIDSRGRLAFAVNRGDFAATYGVGVPSALRVPFKTPR